ncbi:hypothetical protein BTJ68_07108 [Hortaea werneckii EXF-2000]|uniref:NADH:flavin oxidoreductase/NADH oxidase N-terminal domain-containing protein n=1 Tax=Hortaea werneckii EXF-2000 TaxID=1157616 RepID=A0A1Z5TEB6_HORWE|nr:hypothetical protein BTJ68_07108 [Hortaea werneckii EXF-2000]
MMEVEEIAGDWERILNLRSLTAGVDVIKVHRAHGHLIHQSFSSIADRQTDAYGGSFERRTKLLQDVISIYAPSYSLESPLPPSELHRTVNDTIALTRIASDLGSVMLGVSIGGDRPEQRINTYVR